MVYGVIFGLLVLEKLKLFRFNTDTKSGGGSPTSHGLSIVLLRIYEKLCEY